MDDDGGVVSKKIFKIERNYQSKSSEIVSQLLQRFLIDRRVDLNRIFLNDLLTTRIDAHSRKERTNATPIKESYSNNFIPQHKSVATIESEREVNYRLLFCRQQWKRNKGRGEEKLRWQFVVTLWDFYASHMAMWVAIKMWYPFELFTWLWIWARRGWRRIEDSYRRSFACMRRTRFLGIHYSDKSNCHDTSYLSPLSGSVSLLCFASKYVSLISISMREKQEKRFETLPAKRNLMHQHALLLWTNLRILREDSVCLRLWARDRGQSSLWRQIFSIQEGFSSIQLYMCSFVET